jgi:hypothetical protein
MQITQERLGLREQNVIINKKLMCGNTNVSYIQTAPLGDPFSPFLKGINTNKESYLGQWVHKKETNTSHSPNIRLRSLTSLPLVHKCKLEYASRNESL